MTGVTAGFSPETHGVYVDDVDLDILRWMYPGGVMSLWGTDPRITATEIASHVGLDRTAVWARVRKWKREGFWEGFIVDVNLTYFGVGLHHASIHVADPAEGCALMDKLESVEGVVGASLHFGDSMAARDVEFVAVMMVADSPERIARRMRILRRLSPTGSVNGPVLCEPPPCTRELTPLDWRIIAALLANPNRPISQVARLVGVTLKTFIRHHSALIDDHAVSYALKLDWSRMGCVTLGVRCRDAGDVDEVHRAFEARFPHLIPMALEGLGGVSPDYDPSCCFAVIVPARSPHEVQTLIRDLSKIPGVRLVRPELWGPQRRFPGWFYPRIAEHLAQPEDLPPRLLPRSGGPKGSGRSAPALQEELRVAAH